VSNVAGHHRIDYVAMNVTPPITPGWKLRQRYRSLEITAQHRREAHQTNKRHHLQLVNVFMKKRKIRTRKLK
jgi:hypothetical protein